MKQKDKPLSEQEKNTLREEVIDAMNAAKNVKARIRRGPKTVRYTITYSVPRTS